MPKNKRDEYIGMENYNSKGYLMKIVTYNTYNNIEVEFLEPYPCRVKTGTGHFLKGEVTNPYVPAVFDIGMVGNKYPTIISKTKKTKEYNIWYSILRRSYSDYYKSMFPTYKDVTCDPVWFYYDNFYNWVHSQSNYEAIKNMDYNIDKDILFKGNRIYTPEKCTLVPQYINKLIIKQESTRGDCLIGVVRNKNGTYGVYCNDGKNQKHINNYKSELDAFFAYKEYKEKTIKRIAQEAYNNGFITEQCYDALMNYEINITD